MVTVLRTAAGALTASAPEALASAALVGAAALLALGAEAGPRAPSHGLRPEHRVDCPMPRSVAAHGGTTGNTTVNAANGADALAEWYALLWTDLE